MLNLVVSFWALRFAIDVAVRESVIRAAASAASPVYVKFQAVIKSAASAASLRGGRASGRLDRGLFSYFLAALAAKEYKKTKEKLPSRDLYIGIPIGF